MSPMNREQDKLQEKVVIALSVLTPVDKRRWRSGGVVAVLAALGPFANILCSCSGEELQVGEGLQVVTAGGNEVCCRAGAALEAKLVFVLFFCPLCVLQRSCSP